MNGQRGFTLLEVLVAVALASLLLTSIYGVFTASSETKERVEKRANAMHLARVLTSRIERELLGLSLDGQRLEILAGGSNSHGEPFLQLLTSSSGSAHPGMRWVSYRLGADQDNRMTLWRSEKGVNEQTKAVEERLAQGLENLSFAFFDGSSWRQEWQSLADGRPRLVRAEIELSEIEAEPPLVGVFSLPQSRGSHAGQ